MINFCVYLQSQWKQFETFANDTRLSSVIHALPCIVTAFKSSGTIKKFHVFISFNPGILIFYWFVDFDIQKRNILNSDELAKENVSNQTFNVLQANIKITWLCNNILVLVIRQLIIARLALNIIHSFILKQRCMHTEMKMDSRNTLSKIDGKLIVSYW